MAKAVGSAMELRIGDAPSFEKSGRVAAPSIKLSHSTSTPRQAVELTQK